MSAVMTAAERIDSFDKLLAVLSVSKEDIAARAEEERKQYAITASLKAQFDEAKAAIAKHASKESELSAREIALTSEKAAHAEEHTKKMKELEDRVASENKRLEAFSVQLDTRKHEQDAIQTKQAAESARLISIAANHDKEHQKVMQRAVERENNAKSIEATNLAEQQRLREWDASLKAKAARLREQIANF